MASDPTDLPSFESYHKIAESTGRWRLDEADTRLLTKARWVATEKIHGANFSFITDGTTIQCAKRKALLEEGDSFFQHETVLARLHDAILELFAQVLSVHPTAKSVQIYGELFGGGYPHPDVEVIDGMQSVQTGVYYCPDIRFCAFDVAVDTVDDDEEPYRFFLDYILATELLDAAGVMHAEPLLIGSYEECLDMSIRFDSTLPALLELPALDPGTNLAEGVVIKPVPFFQVESPKGPIRPIIKRKIDEFAEDARFHQAQRWVPKTQDASQYALDMLEWEMLARVNPNRLANAVSKIGQVKKSETSALAALLVEDVWEALEEEHGQLVASVSAEEKALLRSVLEDEAHKLVLKHA